MHGAVTGLGLERRDVGGVQAVPDGREPPGVPWAGDRLERAPGADRGRGAGGDRQQGALADPLDLETKPPTGLLVEAAEPRRRGRPVEVVTSVPGDRQRAEGSASDVDDVRRVPVHPGERGQAVGRLQHVAGRPRVPADPVQRQQQHLAVGLAVRGGQRDRQAAAQGVGVDVAVVDADQALAHRQRRGVGQRAGRALRGVPGMAERSLRAVQRLQELRLPDGPPAAGVLDHPAAAEPHVATVDQVARPAIVVAAREGGTVGAVALTASGAPRAIADEYEAGGVAATLLREVPEGDENARRPGRVRVVRRTHHAEDPTHRVPLPPRKSRATACRLIRTQQR
jgi:hypothetical protein